MDEQKVCSVSSEPSQSSSRFALSLTTHQHTEHLTRELHKSEVLLIANTAFYSFSLQPFMTELYFLHHSMDFRITSFL